ncbi:RRNA intron-encoded homing endonuclease [Cucumis melo var. makuwa]|uniref:rRNA intron-encoded homing endonuclease n=1 Tax=Cucumis melo var. makuwa TaxID=1194695 RepID=A0A5D3BY96_CUCMM|nr:RRNA intron-encoded homing endonuclease [Cucumis melo var. makuwa]TYK04145.1 RRNA intron-encoded homing endonuclease [Cucumis melo var. makuwa]
MGGGAWSFLVGGAISMVNFVNEGDYSLLTSYAEIIAIVGLQRGIPSKRKSSARVDYVSASCTHRHRSYRFNGLVKCSDRGDVGDSLPATSREVH